MVGGKTIAVLVCISLSLTEGFRALGHAPDTDDILELPPYVLPPNSKVDRVMDKGGEGDCKEVEYVWEPNGVSIGQGALGQVIEVRNVKRFSWIKYLEQLLRQGRAFFSKEKIDSKNVLIEDKRPGIAVKPDVMWLSTFFQNSERVFALKFALSNQGVAGIKKEIDVMREAKRRNCTNVMSFVDESPCFKNNSEAPKRLPHAYVSLRMVGDLHAWLKESRKGKTIEQCANKVAADLKRGLVCLHRTGYSHSDFKPDNVVFEKTDESGCPAGLRLADFGTSKWLNSKARTYESSQTGKSFHLADSIFNGPGNILGLKSSDQRFYVVKPILDWCSYSFTMQTSFGMQLEELFGNSDLVSCGPMGYGRRKVIYAPNWM